MHQEICEKNYQVVRAKRLASAWQLKMSGSFSRELKQYSYNDEAASLAAFGETSISVCNDMFLASNFYAGQHPKPQHRFPHQKKTLHWFQKETLHSQPSRYINAVPTPN